MDEQTPHQRMLAEANALVRTAGLFPRWAHGRDHSTLQVERLTDGKKIPLRGIRFPRDLMADADLVEVAFAALREALDERNWDT
ncbi:hypothetical protein [Actinocorallia lasiicapitis]